MFGDAETHFLAHLIKRNFVGVSVCLNSYKTSWRTDIKLGTIDHLLGMSVKKVRDVTMTS